MAKSRLSSSGQKSRLSSSKRKKGLSSSRRKTVRKTPRQKAPLGSRPRKGVKSPIRADRLKKIRRVRAPGYRNPYIRSRGCLGCLLPAIVALLVVLAVLVVAF